MTTVLYCDDDLMLRRFVSVALRGTPHHVETVSDGLLALAFLSGNQVDLVLTDLHMPGCDGLCLLARLKADPAFTRLPVVLVTGEHLPTQEVLPLASAVLRKPFTRAELLATIEMVLACAGQ